MNNKIGILFVCMVWLMVLSTTCGLCASVYVPANYVDVLTPVLQAGVLYQFTSSGIWYYGMAHDWRVAADTSWFHDYATGQWTEAHGLSMRAVKLYINGSEPDWLGSTDGVQWTVHAYSPDHIYKYYVMGSGTTASLGIYDNPSDNLGGLTVEIVPVPEPNIQGTVKLKDFSSIKTGITGTATITDSINTEIHDIVLDVRGKYSFNTSLSGICSITIKCSHWLSNTIYGVEIADGINIGEVTLTNGDVVDNNEVDFSDINAVRAAYGSIEGDTNWNPMADVDRNGEVDFSDINIVRSNYGEIGE